MTRCLQLALRTPITVRSAHALARLAWLMLAAPVLIAQSPASDGTGKPLTVAAIFAHGSLIGTLPEQISWSPDGKHLVWEDGGELIDLDPGAASSATAVKPHVLVSRAKLASIYGEGASERDRDRSERYQQASYLWAPDSAHLLFNANGRLWSFDPHNGTGFEIGFTGSAFGNDPRIAPDGDSISFVRDHGLSVLHRKDPGSPTVVAAAAPGPGILSGEVDWVYEEELGVRSNYCWSPDSKRLAYLQSNETAVPEYPLIDWTAAHSKTDSQRYPQPGDANPEVRVGVVGSEGGKTAWIKLPINPGQDYIPRFGWADRNTLWIETLSRDHKRRELYFAEIATGRSRLALTIADEKFVDENYDLFVGNGSIVLSNWADGHNHLYLYKYDAAAPASAPAGPAKQLTSGAFEVGSVLRVDASLQQIDYAANEGNPLEQQLWEVGFDGKRRQLTTGAGFHEGIFSPNGEWFVDRHSTRLEPPTLQLCNSGGACTSFWQTHALDSYHLTAPLDLQVKAHDGTILHATLLLPAGTAPASVPLILNPYGGPGVQKVVNRWGGEALLFDELLAQRGFAVLRTDNRGTSNRGREFAQAAYRNFGLVQLEDQLTVLDEALASNPQLDPHRLGWWGWSWGGSFTLYALTHSDRFRAGVAVAPVTDWRSYDSIYTERYLGLPIESAASYRDFSAVNAAAKLKGRLLLVQGTGDDNVHMQNAMQFADKLIEAGIPYDLQIYPRKTHSIAGAEARIHLYARILAHFEQFLKAPAASTTQ